MINYCGNNPVVSYDPSGNIRVSVLEREVFTVPVTEQITVPSPEDQVYGIINGQELLPYADEPIGLGSYGRTCCPYIAVYNALQLLGKGKPLSEITAEIFWDYGTVFFGAGGVSPWVVEGYLRDQGLSLTGHYKETVLTEDITDGSIIVFTAMFPSGWHAMTAQYNDGKYWVYNQYNRRAITYDYQSLSGAYEGGIFIYGVRIDP